VCRRDLTVLAPLLRASGTGILPAVGRSTTSIFGLQAIAAARAAYTTSRVGLAEADTDRAHIRRKREAMEILWILLGILYVACWIFLGLATFRKGHYWLFWIGFIFPILWIVGALIRPTPRAAARLAQTA